MNILRRLPLSRLMLVCGLVLVAGASLTALAFALGSAPKPAPKPLAVAVHDALDSPAVAGLSADVTLTNHLLEGADLASGGEGGELASNPLLTGASGRLWIAPDGRVRIELQSEQGDTQVLYDGSTLSLYDAASNTLYRYTVPPRDGNANTPGEHHQAPSVAKVEEGISKLSQSANLSAATPTNVGGQPAYTVHVSPKESGSLIGGAELSFDAVHGLPLRAAFYSSTSSSPVLELAAGNVSYGPVADSVFAFTPPANAKIVEVKTPDRPARAHHTDGADRPKLTTHGHGLSSIAVIEATAKAGGEGSTALESLPKVKISGVDATVLGTQLGTVLSFERSGVRYLLAGAVTPATIETLARGL